MLNAYLGKIERASINGGVIRGVEVISNELWFYV
jgi:hypothetical protein